MSRMSAPELRTWHPVAAEQARWQLSLCRGLLPRVSLYRTLLRQAPLYPALLQGPLLQATLQRVLRQRVVRLWSSRLMSLQWWLSGPLR